MDSIPAILKKPAYDDTAAMKVYYQLTYKTLEKELIKKKTEYEKQEILYTIELKQQKMVTYIGVFCFGIYY